ncbi:MAG: hypothetical protein V2J10_05085, partial [Wenzhouxiangella sp.]|nr:hypothetical protein [Wenzhouxiangella sp.]
MLDPAPPFVIPDLIRDLPGLIGRYAVHRQGADATSEIPALRCASAGMTGDAVSAALMPGGSITASINQPSRTSTIAQEPTVRTDKPDEVIRIERIYDTDYEIGQDNIETMGMDVHNPVFLAS